MAVVCRGASEPTSQSLFGIVLLTISIVAPIFDWPYALFPASAALGIFIGTALQLRNARITDL